MGTAHPPAVDELESGLTQPLLLNGENKEISGEGEEEEDSEDVTSEDSHKPANTLRSAYRLLTPSVKVCFSFLLFTLKEISNIQLPPKHVI